MRYIPDEAYVTAVGRYRSMMRRLEAGDLTTKELLVRSIRAVSKSRELLVAPAPKSLARRQGFNISEDKKSD
jgi:hypothetical protein